MDHNSSTKKIIKGTKKNRSHTYSCRSKYSIGNMERSKRHRYSNRNNTKKSLVLKEEAHKKEISKKEKKTEKKNIKRATTITEGRLTEPKKRSLFRRILLQIEYNNGFFDFIEEEYDDLTISEIENYKNSDDSYYRKYYKEVQKYEDLLDDITVRNGWLALKVGLATTMLCASIGIVNNTIKEIHALAPEEPAIITLDNATQEEIEHAKNDINMLKINVGYNFESLTYFEQVDAGIRISSIEEGIDLNTFKNSITYFKDQDLLDEIVTEAFGKEEYSTYLDDKKWDLRKLAYELLQEEKKEYIRDPQRLKEIEEKNEVERAEREINQIKVNARLDNINLNDQEIELE